MLESIFLYWNRYYCTGTYIFVLPCGPPYFSRTIHELNVRIPYASDVKFSIM